MKKFVPLITTSAVVINLFFFKIYLNTFLQLNRNVIPFIMVFVYSIIPTIWLLRVNYIGYSFNFINTDKVNPILHIVCASSILIIHLILKLTLSEIFYFPLVIVEEIIGRFVIINLFSYYSKDTPLINITLSSICFAAGHFYHQNNILTLMSGIIAFINGILFTKFNDILLIIWSHYIGGILFFRVNLNT